MKEIISPHILHQLQLVVSDSVLPANLHVTILCLQLCSNTFLQRAHCVLLPEWSSKVVVLCISRSCTAKATYLVSGRHICWHCDTTETSSVTDTVMFGLFSLGSDDTVGYTVCTWKFGRHCWDKTKHILYFHSYLRWRATAAKQSPPEYFYFRERQILF